MKIITSATTKFLLLALLLSSAFFMSGGRVEAATANWAYQVLGAIPGYGYDYWVPGPIGSGGFSNCSSVGYTQYATCTAFDINNSGEPVCTDWAPIPLESPYDIWVMYTWNDGSEWGGSSFNQCQFSSGIYGTVASFSATDNSSATIISTDASGINTYAPSTTISISVLAGGGGEGNSFNSIDPVSNAINNLLWGSSPEAVGVSAYYDGVDVSHCEDNGSCTGSGSFLAPPIPGTYPINLTGCWIDNSDCATSNMTFKVACASGTNWNGSSCVSCASPNTWNSTTKTCDAPVDTAVVYGACDNTGEYNCAPGVASSKSGDATNGYTWSCDGTPNDADHRATGCSYKATALPTASFTPPAPSCNIKAGDSSCRSPISWTSANVTNAALTDCGGGAYILQGPGAKTYSDYGGVTVPAGSVGCYQIRENSYTGSVLATTNGTAVCELNSTWDDVSKTCVATTVPTWSTPACSPATPACDAKAYTVSATCSTGTPSDCTAPQPTLSCPAGAACTTPTWSTPACSPATPACDALAYTVSATCSTGTPSDCTAPQPTTLSCPAGADCPPPPSTCVPAVAPAGYYYCTATGCVASAPDPITHINVCTATGCVASAYACPTATGCCTSAPNSCGKVGYGHYTINCNGTVTSPCDAVKPADPPVTATISVVPTRVKAIGTTLVSWTTGGATSCSITKNGSLLKTLPYNSSCVLTPPTSVTDTNVTTQSIYTILCTNSVNGQTDQKTSNIVNVVPSYQEF